MQKSLVATLRANTAHRSQQIFFFAVLSLMIFSALPSPVLASTVDPLSLPYRDDKPETLQRAVDAYLKQNDDLALRLLIGLSKRGNSDADTLLGYLYSDPLFVGMNLHTAVHYFEAAVKQGNNVEAIFQLSEQHHWPGGQPSSKYTDSDLNALLMKAAKRKHTGAIARLALNCWESVTEHSCKDFESFGGSSALEWKYHHYFEFVKAAKALNAGKFDLYKADSEAGVVAGNPHAMQLMYVTFVETGVGSDCDNGNNLSAFFLEAMQRNGIDVSGLPGIKAANECRSNQHVFLDHFRQWALKSFDKRQPYFTYCSHLSVTQKVECIITARDDDFLMCGRISLFEYLHSIRLYPADMADFYSTPRYRACREYFLQRDIDRDQRAE